MVHSLCSMSTHQECGAHDEARHEVLEVRQDRPRLQVQVGLIQPRFKP